MSFDLSRVIEQAVADELAAWEGGQPPQPAWPRPGRWEKIDLSLTDVPEHPLHDLAGSYRRILEKLKDDPPVASELLPHEEDVRRYLRGGWMTVTSPHVTAARYLGEEQVLEVEYHVEPEGTAVYRYDHVTEAEARQFAEAPSKGRWIWAQMRGTVWVYARSLSEELAPPPPHPELDEMVQLAHEHLAEEAAREREEARWVELSLAPVRQTLEFSSQQAMATAKSVHDLARAVAAQTPHFHLPEKLGPIELSVPPPQVTNEVPVEKLAGPLARVLEAQGRQLEACMDSMLCAFEAAAEAQEKAAEQAAEREDRLVRVLESLTDAMRSGGDAQAKAIAEVGKVLAKQPRPEVKVEPNLIIPRRKPPKFRIETESDGTRRIIPEE